MNKLTKKLAVKAGFDLDPDDCNFYSPEAAQWINKEISRLSDLVVEEVVVACNLTDEQRKKLYFHFHV